MAGEVHDGVMNMNHDMSQPAAEPFHGLTQKSREELLNGPAPLFIGAHTGTTFDYVHQCEVAKGMVCADRTRQLHEQSQSHNRPYAIEFPAHALAAASPLFKQGYEGDPGVAQMPLDLGIVLPGYAMCVLDWYGRALRSKQWYDFVPEDASTEGDDKWYWVYCYSAMRSLGMDDFAVRLQVSIEGMLDGLAVDFESFAHLIRTLPEDDPILSRLAEHTAHNMLAQSLRITETECRALAEHFPRFAEHVNEAMKWR